jgi:hypothetical protein
LKLETDLPRIWLHNVEEEITSHHGEPNGLNQQQCHRGALAGTCDTWHRRVAK